MNNSSNNINNIILTSKLSIVDRYFKFYFLLIMHIPSLCCTIFILFHFKWNRLVSQIFGILLIVNALLILAELPFTLIYLYDGLVRNENICPGWVLVNYTLFILSIILTAWTSIERYLFIYHEHFITHYQILLHYFPIGFCTLYTPSFYVGLVIFYPCQQAYTPYSYICNGPCYLFQIVPCMIDWGINVVFVLLITCIVNIILIVSNIKQKHRMKRSIITTRNSHRWRRSIKLSVQLFSISILCIIGWVPYGVVSTMLIFNDTEFLSYLLSTFFIYFPYVQTLFLPYACLLFIPEIKQKFYTIMSSFWCFKIIKRRNQVHIGNNEQHNILTRFKLVTFARAFSRTYH